MDLKRTSRFLSRVLRHAPDAIGLTLDREGWASVPELIERSGRAAHHFDKDALARIAAGNDKKRFTLSPDGTRIRAAQGHTIDVQLGLPPVEPAPAFFHGTATRFLSSIREQGLIPGSRRQVLLSADRETATNVGARHGKPVVLVVAALRMHQDGFVFNRADNGVWLTGHVPAKYLVDSI